MFSRVRLRRLQRRLLSPRLLARKADDLSGLTAELETQRDLCRGTGLFAFGGRVI